MAEERIILNTEYGALRVAGIYALVLANAPRKPSVYDDDGYIVLGEYDTAQRAGRVAERLERLLMARAKQKFDHAG